MIYILLVIDKMQDLPFSYLLTCSFLPIGVCLEGISHLELHIFAVAGIYHEIGRAHV